MSEEKTQCDSQRRFSQSMLFMCQLLLAGCPYREATDWGHYLKFLFGRQIKKNSFYSDNETVSGEDAIRDQTVRFSLQRSIYV